MQSIIAKKIDERIREYLKKQFPKRKLVRLEKAPSYEGEIYGIFSMQIQVWDEADAVYYKLIKAAK